MPASKGNCLLASSNSKLTFESRPRCFANSLAFDTPNSFASMPLIVHPVFSAKNTAGPPTRCRSLISSTKSRSLGSRQNNAAHLRSSSCFGRYPRRKFQIGWIAERQLRIPRNKCCKVPPYQIERTAAMRPTTSPTPVFDGHGRQIG